MAVVNSRLLNNPIMQRMPKTERDWIHFMNELAKFVLRVAKLGDGTLTTSGGTTISGLDEMPGEVGTTQITDESVTTITTATEDSASLSNGGSTLVTLLPDQGTAYTLLLTCTFDAWKATAATTEAKLWIATATGDLLSQPCEIFSTSAPGQRVTLQFELSVTTAMEVGGSRINVFVFHEAENIAGTEILECRNMTLRAEAVKK